MLKSEFANIIDNAKQSNSEYVISAAIIKPNGFIPDHYYKWEDQTFHIVEGDLEVKIRDGFIIVSSGDTIHCPRGISHYMKNKGPNTARLISYIFPRDWAEAYFEENL